MHLRVNFSSFCGMQISMIMIGNDECSNLIIKTPEKIIYYMNVLVEDRNYAFA